MILTGAKSHACVRKQLIAVLVADCCCATCCIVSGKKFDETEAWCRGWSWVVPSTRWPRFVAMMHHRPRRRGCCGWRRATRGEAADPDQSGAPFSFWGRTFVCSRGPCLNSPKGSPNDRGVLCQQPSFPSSRPSPHNKNGTRANLILTSRWIPT